jgi:5-methylcytosine-specific restriction endonuclease McrBC regulatory subunit McrC
MPKSALSNIKFPGNNVTNIRKNPANIGCVAFDNVRQFSEDGRCRRMYMLYKLLRQFAKIFLLAIPSVRDARMWLLLRGCAWIWYRFICIYLFDVEENLWSRCSCFRHASIANSQTPGRLELVGF